VILHLTGRGVSVSRELQRRIEAKIAKMQRLFPKLVEARVVLATERYRHLAEVTLQAKGATFHVEGAAPDFHAAVDQALTSLTAQIRRRKERVTAKKSRSSRPGQPSLAVDSSPESVDEAPPTPPVVVRRTNAKPMSIEEAVDQLRLRADGLLVFRNARTRTVSVLRRRPDGTVELVEPAG
jgi:putative sigma-54 modulation protein